MQHPFVILTGASGVGKTAIAECIEKLDPAIAVYQGDKLDPLPEKILESYGPAIGPGGASQRGFALYWIGKIAAEPPAKPILLEMQCRIAFIQEALLRYSVQARVVLVEASDRVREHRLIHDRRQPELANPDMAKWSCFLHEEAFHAGYEIIDTSKTSLEQVVQHIRSYLIPGGV